MKAQLQEKIRQYEQILAEINAVEFQCSSMLHELERHNYLMDIKQEVRNEKAEKRVGPATT